MVAISVALIIITLACAYINVIVMFVVMVASIIGVGLYIAGYCARRRCTHCGWVPKMEQADYPICPQCRNERWH